MANAEFEELLNNSYNRERFEQECVRMMERPSLILSPLAEMSIGDEFLTLFCTEQWGAYTTGEFVDRALAEGFPVTIRIGDKATTEEAQP